MNEKRAQFTFWCRHNLGQDILFLLKIFRKHIIYIGYGAEVNFAPISKQPQRETN